MSSKRLSFFKFYHFYYVLAVFDIAMLAISLSINHQNLNVFEGSIKQNESFVRNLKLSEELAAAAGEANAPGNDVFDSHNVKAERARLDIATKNFKTKLHELNQLAKENQLADISERLSRIDNAFEKMREEALNIFTAFEYKRHGYAASRMATMDQKFALLNQELASVRKDFSDLQSSSLSDQSQYLAKLSAFEKAVGFAIMMMVLLVTLFGKKLGRAVELREKQIKETVDKLNACLNSVKMGIWEWDLVKNELRWDSHMYELYGVRHGDFSGAFDAWEKCVHPDDAPRVKAELELALAGEKPFDTRFRVITASKEVRVIAAKANVHVTENKKPMHVIGVNWDVTDLARAENEAHQVTEALNLAAIVAVTNTKGRIIKANDNFCKISGYSSEELIGQDHRILNSGHHPKVFFKDLWSTISRGEIWQGEIQNRAKDGRYYWVHTIISPARDLAGQISKYVSVRFDVTEQKAAQSNMMHSSKMSSLGEMAGGVAHEINNPLAIISGKAGIIKRRLEADSFDKAAVITDIVKVEQTAQRIAKIIRGLRVFSRNAEADPASEVKVSQIIDDTLELCRERFKNHGIELKVNSALDAQIECRAAQISQVVLNLLNNAHDAIEHAEEKWVELTVKVHQDSCDITVTDSGRGIAPEIVTKIMQPFFTTKEVGKGTGLGLSISKGIVEDHEGSLKYDDTHPNTRFIVNLPFKLKRTKKAPEPSVDATKNKVA